MNADESEQDIYYNLWVYTTDGAKSLKKMSEGYVKGFNSVDELYAIGQYAKDSWEIFQKQQQKSKSN